MADSSKTAGSAQSVQVSLTLDDASRQDIPFPTRVLTLDRENDSIVVGRASKVETKGLLSLPNNAWFLSPVMSRKHAEIAVDLDHKMVKVKDLRSLHGTFLNGVKLPHGDEGVELRHGAKLRFGVPIYRGTENFPPTSVDVGITFCNEQDDTPTTTFQVPDCSDVEDYSSDENSDTKEITEQTIPALAKTRMGSIPSDMVVDLTLPRQRDTLRHSGNIQHEIIDLLSPRCSPGPSSAELVIDDDDEDISNSAVEAPTQGPGITPDTQPSARAASPDLSTANAEISVDIGMPTAVFSPLDEYEDEDIDGYKSSGDEEMSDDDGSDSDDDGDRRSVDSLDVDGSDSSLSNPPDHIHSEEESFFISDNEEDMEPELEDDEFDDEYSSDDGSSNNGFPDAEFRSAFWEESSEHAPPQFPAPSPQQSIPIEASSVEKIAPVQSPVTPVPAITAVPLDMEPIKGPSGPASNAAKSTEAVTIQKLLNEEKSSVHRVMPSEVPLSGRFDVPAVHIARDPSPSDAAMPKSSHITSTEKRRTAAEILGELTGKSEFFAAREENKLLAKVQNASEARFTPSVYAICNGARVDASGPFNLTTTETFALMTKNLEKLTENLEKDKQRFGIPKPTASAQIHWTSEPMLDSLNEAPSGMDHPVDSQPLCDIWASEAPRGDLLDFTDALLDQPSRRTHLGISDIVDGCQETLAQSKAGKTAAKTISDSKPEEEARLPCKGKRKSEAISISSADEEQWAQNTSKSEQDNHKPQTLVDGNAGLHDNLSKSVDTPIIPACGMGIQTSGVPADIPKTLTPITTEITERPAKRLRHIAERFGYAALGGVTASAMIFGTLVYTAPTFV